MPARILVVDDEPDIQKVVVARLQTAGYECLQAHDGHEGFYKAHDDLPDLILLDLAMPRASGDEVCRLLKSSQDPRVSAIPIILLTGQDEVRQADGNNKIGADCYLSKPFKLEELLNEVKKRIRVK